VIDLTTNSNLSINKLMDKPQMLHLKAEVIKSDDDEDGIVDAIVASTPILDRQGDVIDQSGWDIKNFKKNPVILWGHNVRDERPPIGKAVKTWIEGEGKKAQLMFKAQFDMADVFAADIFRKVKEGFLNMVSVGFLPTEWEAIDKDDGPFGGRRYLKQELLEISFVPVPANPEAAVQIREMGTEPIDMDKLYPQVELEDEEKGVIPFKATSTAPESSAWDGPGEVSRAEISDLKAMCTWFDSEKPDVKSSYKLPHHKAEGHTVVWRGVAAAMAALLGARGGVQIPDSDRKGVYNHLKRHYAQFDKEAPDFRMVEDQVLKVLSEEIDILTLDREDRYIVRLIKKLLKMNQEKIRDVKNGDKTEAQELVAGALKIVDQAVASAIKKLEVKGGEKNE